ncbi:MAG: hemolysin family protein [Chloroflexota bacterium]|nr:hemolysin family protein [Chloroflexota bacterium]
MTATAIEILLVVVLIGVNGVLSMSEMAVASSRKARLQERAARGDAGSRTALGLAESPNRFLSTVQIGITLVGILTGAFGGATIAAQLDAGLETVPGLGPYSEVIALSVVVVVITYVTLILGELVPKRLALSNPEGIASAISRPMSVLSRIAAPVVALLSVSTDAVLRLFGVRTSTESQVTEEEIKVMIDQGTDAGVFHQAEHDLVDGVLSLADRQVGELMTPRPKVVWLDVEAPPEENWRKTAAAGHAYYPVCDGDLDHVLGMISVKDLWAQGVDGHAPDLRSLLRPALAVPEHVRALQVLEVFKQTHKNPGSERRAHLEVAVVVGEHGGTEGLITPTDVLEAIVGDLPASGQGEPDSSVQRDDGSWLVDGALPVFALEALLGVPEAAAGQRELYHTAGGLVMTHLGRVPTAGDALDWRGWRLEVADMDGRRVDKLLATPLTVGSDSTETSSSAVV